MKYCPNCQANVEGLIHHCDCCGALLNEQQQKSFWAWQSFEMAYDFHTYVNLSMKKIESIEKLEYKPYFEEIYIGFFCYPAPILEYLKIKKNVRCSLVKKNVNITVVVNYNEFVNSNQEKKQKLVENSILEAIEKMELRLLKLKVKKICFSQKIRTVFDQSDK